MSRMWSWLSFYAAALAVSLAGMGLLAVVFALPNWQMAGVGVWFIICFASLCFPDDFPSRWVHLWKK